MSFPKRVSGVVVAQAHDGYLATDSGGKLSSWLNRTAYLIFLMANGQNSEREIAAAIRKLFDLANNPETHVKRVLADLAKAGLIEDFEPDKTSSFSVLISLWVPGESVLVETMQHISEITTRLDAEKVPYQLVYDREPSHQHSRNRALSALIAYGQHSHVLLLEAKANATGAVAAINLRRILEANEDVVAIPVRSDRPSWSVAADADLANPIDLEAYSHTYNVTVKGVEGKRKTVGEFTQVAFAGSAAMLISRVGLEKMIATKYVNRYRGFLGVNRTEHLEHHWGFFDSFESSGRLVIGDLAFCERVRLAGGAVMIDTKGQFGDSLRAARLIAKRSS